MSRLQIDTRDLTSHSPIPLISDIRFTGLALDRHAGLSFLVSASAPPGPARNPNQGARWAFWNFGKRLVAGGMVALVTHRTGTEPDVRMAVVSSGMLSLMSARQST